MQLRDRLREVDARLAVAEQEVGESGERSARRATRPGSCARRPRCSWRPTWRGSTSPVRRPPRRAPPAPSGAAAAAWSSPPLHFRRCPADKVYQVWVVADAHPPISAGLLEPDRDGNAIAVSDTPEDIPTPKVLAVTLEPAGGVPQPTGDKILVGVTGL